MLHCLKLADKRAKWQNWRELNWQDAHALQLSFTQTRKHQIKAVFSNRWDGRLMDTFMKCVQKRAAVTNLCVWPQQFIGLHDSFSIVFITKMLWCKHFIQYDRVLQLLWEPTYENLSASQLCLCSAVLSTQSTRVAYIHNEWQHNWHVQHLISIIISLVVTWETAQNRLMVIWLCPY